MYNDIIKSTIPRVMFNAIEKSMTQLGISISRISISTTTNAARPSSVIEFEPCAPAIRFV